MSKVLANAEKLEEAKNKGASSAPASGGDASGLKSEKHFNMMGNFLARGEGKDVVAKVQGIYTVEIVPKKNAKPVAVVEINLKDG